MKHFFSLMMIAILSIGSVCAAKYVKVTSTDDLASGDVVVLGCQTKGKASGELTSGYLSAVAATFSGDTLICNDATELTMQGGGTSWIFYLGTNSLGATAEKMLSTDNTNSSFANSWTVSIESDGTATILLHTSKFKDTKLMYNASSPRFSNYATNQSAVQIYKKVIVSGQVLEARSSVDFGNVALSSGQASASATLSVSGENLPEAIDYILSNGTHFSATGTLTANGGSLSLSFAATAVGTYRDTLLLAAGTASKEVCLSATVVNAPAAGATSFGLVTDVAQLMSGAELILVCTTKGKAAGDISSGVMEAVGVTITDGTIDLPDSSAVVVLTLGGNTGAWTFTSEESVLGCTAVKKMAWDASAATWSIAIDASGNATITNATASCGTICYNTGSPRFTTYAATSSSCILPQLYMRGAGSVPTSLEDAPAASAAQKILRNGRILILRDGITYDLNGRVVE